MILIILCKIWKRIYNFQKKKDFEVTDKPNFTNACIVIFTRRKLSVTIWSFYLHVRINQIIYACHKVTQGLICLTYLIWRLIEYTVDSHLSAVYEGITIYHRK